MGLLSGLGSFGARIWGAIKSIAEPIRTAFGLGRAAGIEPEPSALEREYRKVIRLEGLAEQIGALERDAYIPPDLYQASEIPWKRPFAYEVTMSGRDLATGRFTRTARVLTFSRQLSIGEIEDEAVLTFGSGGASEQIDVTHLSVTAAEYRAGEESRLW